MGFLWFLVGWFWFFLKLECCILEAFPFKISLQMVAQLWNPNTTSCCLLAEEQDLEKQWYGAVTNPSLVLFSNI